ncbi:hypothetical protein KQ945_15545 [Bacillus subtilis subsp. subtilis]|nr:hypothetical protein [Bacillus subtilis subsp. subtilis]
MASTYRRPVRRNALSAALREACTSRRAWVVSVGLLGALVSPSALADLYVNGQGNGWCVRLQDPTSRFITGTAPATQWLSDVENGSCDSADKATQLTKALFYRPTTVSGNGATSLTLGGELYVNGGEAHIRQGILKMGEMNGNRIQIGSWNTTTTGDNGIALGSASSAAQDATALGSMSQATAASSTAVGQAAAASQTNAAAVGRSAAAAGASSVAFGHSARAALQGDTAIGASATASGNRSVAVGMSATASSERAVAMGSEAAASQRNAVAIGRSSRASATEAVALGNAANASHAGSVALGDGATTDTVRALTELTLNGRRYPIDNSNVGGVVSVGSALNRRQIINLGAGAVSATSTDAVNGSQLHAAYTAINELAAKDASQDTNIAALGTRLDARDKTLSDRIDALDAKGAGQSGALPREALQSVATAIGGGASLAADGSVVLPAVSLSSPGPGIDARPATLVGAIHSLDAELARQNDSLGAVFENALLWDGASGTFTARHGDAESNRISGVAAGVAATDAVNKGQLDAVEQTAQAARTAAGAATTAATAAGTRADAAATAARTAGDTANAARTAADTAGTKADAATTAAAAAGTRADAATTAATAAGTRADAATTAATAAGTRADTAATAARTAGDSANTAVQTANAARTAADTAGTKADAATTAATAAGTRADAAATAARTAGDSANTAVQTANAARTAAEAAGNQVAAVRDNALLWDAASGTFKASHGDAASSRISGLDAGTAATDAVNKGQLDAVGQIAQSARNDADAATTTANAAGTRADAAAAAARTAGDTATTAAQTANAARAAAESATTVAAAAQTRANEAATTAATAGNRAATAEQTANAARTAVEAAGTQIAAVRDAALLWDEASGTFKASHGDAASSRISAVDAGVAATDAVNKGQLDAVGNTARSALTAADAATSVATAAGGRADAATAAANAAGSRADVATTAATAAGTRADAATAAASAAGTKADAATVAAAAAGTKADEATATATAAGAKADAATTAANAATTAAAAAGTKADHATTAAATAGTKADAATTAANAAGTRADAATTAAAAAGAKADDATAAATTAGTKADAATTAAAAAGTKADQAVVAATAAGTRADAATTAATDAGTRAEAATTAATAAGTKADQATAAAATAGTRADAATLAATEAGTRADAAGTKADQATAAAATAGTRADAATNAAADAGMRAGLATTVATAAGAKADHATAAATTATTAAADAGTRADAATTAANAAGTKADQATAAASTAGTKADAAVSAAAAAGRGTEQLAAALGGGALVGADGNMLAPAYAIGTLGATGVRAEPATAARDVGSALAQMDANVGVVNDRVSTVGEDLRRLRDGEAGLVRQDASSRDIQLATMTDGERIQVAGSGGVRTLTGLKDAVIAAGSSEAVTGAQLHASQRDIDLTTTAVGALEVANRKQGDALKQLAGDIEAGSVGLVKQDPSSKRITIGKQADGEVIDVGGSSGARIVTGLAAGRVDAASSDAVTGSQVHQLAQRLDAVGVASSGLASDGADRVGRAARVAAGTDAVALGADAVASARNSVALGAGSVADRASTVSVGRSGAERQVTHVADGQQDTDAVNLRQTRSIARTVAGQAVSVANQYTDNQVQQLRRQAKAGIAVALASAGLPLQAAPGSRSVAVSGATYGGESAMALGLQAVSEDGGFIFKASGSMSADGDSGASIGVGFSW